MSFFHTLLAAGLLSVSAHAQTTPAVTTHGEAELLVAPDEVLLTLGVQTQHRDMKEGRRLNDERTRAVLTAAREAGVAPADARTDYLHIEPEYHSESGGRRVFEGYVQRTTVVITLKNLASFDKLLTAALEAGAEHVHGIQFRTTQLRKYRDQARSMAMQAAREKAATLAGELGHRIGKPLNIQEGYSGWSSSYGSWWGHGPAQRWSQNVVRSSGGEGGGAPDGALAPGTLSVRANVTVSFELH